MRVTISRRLVLLGALALASCNDNDGPSVSKPKRPKSLMDADAWEIGPFLNGESRSPGMPKRPDEHPEGFAFDIPEGPDSHVHYVTVTHGSLDGKTEMVLRYRIEAPAGVKIVPQDSPNGRSMLSLYFQRAGDNWSAQGEYGGFRWYSPAWHSPLVAGEHELRVRLDANWRAVGSYNASDKPEAFAEVKRKTGRVGFVLGGGSGRGHGVYAVGGKARLIVTSFEVR